MEMVKAVEWVLCMCWDDEMEVLGARSETDG